MKILYVIGQLGRGGAEQQLYYLLKYLRPDACVVSLREDGYWAAPIRELGVEVIELKRRGRADFGRLFQIVRIIRRYKPDIIHIFIDNPYGLYGRLAAIITGHPRVVAGMRTHPRFIPSWYIQLCSKLLNYAVTYIVPNSHVAMDYLAKTVGVPANKLRVIPNGIELDKFSFQRSLSRNILPFGWNAKHIIIGTVASLSPVKAPEIFIEVARRVIKRYPHARFVWVGDGVLRTRIEELREHYRLEDAILLPGHQLNAPAWLAIFDVFILTSILEGSPNAVMEAMASSLPCIVTDVGGNQDLVQDGITGYRTPVKNIEAMSACIGRLVEDARLREEMGAAGRQAIQAYDVHKMVAAYQEIYNNLSSNG